MFLYVGCMGWGVGGRDDGSCGLVVLFIMVPCSVYYTANWFIHVWVGYSIQS